ncbi:MAG: WD40 repeat protein [Pseudohongiellaceae bacterium]
MSNSLVRLIFTVPIALGLSQCSFESEPANTFSTTVRGLFSAEFTKDGEYAAVGSMQHGGSLWQTQSSERLFNWNHTDTGNSQITTVAFSPEGKYAATIDQATIVLWDVNTGAALRFFTAPSEVIQIALGPNADTALLALDGARAIVFDIQNGGVIHELQQEENILSMAMSANGLFAVFGIDNDSVSYWNLKSAQRIATIETAGRVKTLAISDDGKLGFTAVQHIDGLVWDLEQTKVRARLKYSSRFFATSSSFLTGKFSADSQSLVTGNTTGAVELWQTSSGKRLDRWLTPISYGIGPKVYAIVAVAHLPKFNQVIAINSKGTAYSYSL